MKVLVTGCAGFIGYHLSQRLLARGDEVIGVDNLNDYYEVSLKENRLAKLESPSFKFHKLDVADGPAMKALFAETEFDGVIHLAAQAGVRYSITNPEVYIESNLVGFSHILEGARHQKCPHLVYASSSSVYGANTVQPFSEAHNVDHPISLYAATKKANELMAHTYAHLYGLPCTGLRFFTVYGPWGRPDMALFKFAKNILAGLPIDVYNHGEMVRDFTYVDDIIDGVVAVLDKPASSDSAWTGDAPNPATSKAPYRIYNIGNNAPVPLMDFIDAIEKKLGVEAEKNFMPLQEGDVPSTYADVSRLTEDCDVKPSTSIETGVGRFIDWYREYYTQTT